MQSAHIQPLPYKSVAAALMFCVFLGPVGLLYASFWGGFAMIVIGLIVINSKLIFPIVLFWIICCIWGVGSVEYHNKQVYQSIRSASLNGTKENYSARI